MALENYDHALAIYQALLDDHSVGGRGGATIVPLVHFNMGVASAGAGKHEVWPR